jgi:hypothetical protein
MQAAARTAITSANLLQQPTRAIEVIISAS